MMRSFCLYADDKRPEPHDWASALCKKGYRTNHGLRFEKFYGGWEPPAAGHPTKFLEQIGKQKFRPLLEWLQPGLTGDSGGDGLLDVGDAALIGEYTERRCAILRQVSGSQCFGAALITKLALGLGRPHPSNNGFTWHHLLGAPYLPGTGLKQVARAAADAESGVDAATKERIFGEPEPGKVPRCAGSVCFLDGLPAAPQKVSADILNPHYAEYYRENPVTVTHPPADWYTPIPILFLVTVPYENAKFRFALLPRRPSDEDRADTEKAARWLKTGLEGFGAGAKTMLGYGLFRAS